MKYKPSSSITRHEVLTGPFRSFRALEIDGKSPILDFFRDLERDNVRGLASVQAGLRVCANSRLLLNEKRFKYLRDGIYEVRASALRLYCFKCNETLVLLTNGGGKGKKSKQTRDINKAVSLMNRYLNHVDSGGDVTDAPLEN